VKQRVLVGLALAAIGVGVMAAALRSERGRRRAPNGPGAETEVDAAPLLVIRGAFDDVRVRAGDGPRIGIHAFGVAGIEDAVRVRRADDRGRVILSLHPRRRVDVTVPRGTAVRLRLAKGSGRVNGVDDVDLRCAKARVALNDVAGTIRVRAAKGVFDVGLSNERETRSVDIAIAKARLSLDLPAGRGGAYTIEAAQASVTAPPSVEGGIPVAIRAAKARVSIHAA
jgi:hypothetical protein